jgi:hypothetical protein
MRWQDTIKTELFMLFKYAVNFWDYVALVMDERMSMEQKWNYTDRGKPKYSERNLFRRHFFFSTKPKWTGLGLNPDLRGERAVTNRLSHDTSQDLVRCYLLGWKLHGIGSGSCRLMCVCIEGTDHPSSPQRYPYFDVVVGLVWSHGPKSYAGCSVCYW